MTFSDRSGAVSDPIKIKSPMDPMTACHVVAVPYPGRGHVNPMLNLCKLLAGDGRLLITVVVTEEWLRLLAAENPPRRIRFAAIPNVLPSEADRAADMPSFVAATQTKMEEPLEKLLDRLDRPVHFIIADTFLNWAVEFGNRRNIPVASLWAMPASVFAVFHHFDRLVRHGHHPADLSERGDERVSYVPGIPSIRLADLPSIAFMADQRLLRLTRSIFPNVSKAQFLLFTTIYGIESEVVDALQEEFPFPIYTFGPACIPYSGLQTSAAADYLAWLDAQPPNSVLYVSLGSFLSVSSRQMDEIAGGLKDSGVRFLWVARGEAARLQAACGDGDVAGRGRVVAWCDQLRVLCHRAVGGFWTHCGWNSTMEAIFAGVPIIAFPIVMDQVTIRKHVVEDWRIGWDGRRGRLPSELQRREEIAGMVKEFMDSESADRRRMAARAKQVRKVATDAMADGGSTNQNLTSFLNHILNV
ncbi:UDP-glycosyltransferase 87A2-like [Andrographis paniculata]|uniref:UDP-glycosyltransferase 87A2-like n=1 Tax=Andrographis paniculata TaxID=175694 RepID=UPI0021E8677D|nr:UDP-glycosyltransferase 87A2-like [Andrographis paniculata]